MGDKNKQVSDFLKQFDDEQRRTIIDFGRLRAIEDFLIDKGIMTEEENQNYIVEAIYDVHLKDE